MSTSVTSSNGMVVVTQMFPQNQDGTICLPVQTSEPQKVRTPHSAPTKASEMTDTFLRGQPQSLGIVQIFIGLVCMIVSLSAVLSPSLVLGAPLLMGATFVLSGSLALAARRGTRVGLIRTTLVANVLSAVVGVVGTGYVCWLLANRSDLKQLCDLADLPDPADYSSIRIYQANTRNCVKMVWQLMRVLDGVRGLILVLTVLEVCVSITVCVFSGLAISRRGLYTQTTVLVVESGSAQSIKSASVCDSDVALLDAAMGEPASSPPPYSS
ncbi:membrane-spanning 4-domains subfamily A member 4A isoform 1-T2 [Polymixia lowei]